MSFQVTDLVVCPDILLLFFLPMNHRAGCGTLYIARGIVSVLVGLAVVDMTLHKVEYGAAHQLVSLTTPDCIDL